MSIKGFILVLRSLSEHFALEALCVLQLGEELLLGQLLVGLGSIALLILLAWSLLGFLPGRILRLHPTPPSILPKPLNPSPNQPLNPVHKILSLLNTMMASLHNDSHKLLILGLKSTDPVLMHLKLLLEISDTRGQIFDRLILHNGYISDRGGL